jgi:iron complex transport system substrate-binding protein
MERRDSFFCAQVFALSFLLSTSVEGASPKRVITLTPSLAEIALGVGFPEEGIVGVSERTDSTPGLLRKPRIASFERIDFERLVELKPDLVIGSLETTPSHQVKRLETMGFTLELVPLSKLSEIRSAFSRVGERLGKNKEAADAVAKWDREVLEFRSRAALRKNEGSAVFQVGTNPLIVVGGRGFLDEVLGLLGIKNTYSDLRSDYSRVSLEDVVKRDPSRIILLVSTASESEMSQSASEWRSRTQMKASRSAQVHEVRSDALGRPGPRLLQGLRDLEKAVFGQ